MRVTMASARGRASAGHGVSATTTSRRMDLIGGEEAVRLDAERRRHARAVFGDWRGVVVRADAAVEARIDAVGNAAFAGEEGVADAGQRQRLAP